MSEVPKGQYTPLSLVLTTLQASKKAQERPSDHRLPNTKEQRDQEITRFQAMADLLLRYGAK